MEDYLPPPRFREVQRFRQIWVLYPVLAVAGFMWYGAVQQFLFDRPLGNNPPPDIVMLVSLLIFGIGLPALFMSMRMITEVREDGIYVRFVPFHMRFQRFGFDEISKCYARTYRPILEFGGWGVRYSLRGGKVYNVKGKEGVQLLKSDGKKLLIGSQRPEELCGAVYSLAPHLQATGE